MTKKYANSSSVQLNYYLHYSTTKSSMMKQPLSSNKNLRHY